MQQSAPSIESQVNCVRRRLSVQRMIGALIVGWTSALVLAAGWFLVQPFLVGETTPSLRWIVLGSLLGATTIGAAIYAWIRRPTLVESALQLDERFSLRERVTTTITLADQDRGTPAGIALREDAGQRVAPLRVGERFPLRLPRAALLVPLATCAVVLLMLFYNPQVTKASIEEEQQPLSEDPIVLAEIEKKKRLLRTPKKPIPLARRPWSEEMEKLREKSDNLSRKKTDTKEQARDAIKEMTTLEEEMKKRDQVLADRVDALKEQMKQVERLSKQEDNDLLKKKKKGPAQRMDQAFDQGDFDKARQEAERLARRLDPEQEKDRLRKKKEAEEKKDRLKKKQKDPNLDEEEKERLQRELDEVNKELERLENEQMSEEEKEQLREQMQAMQDKLERLTKDKEEREEQLKQLAEQGKLDPEQLAREMDQLQNESEKIDEGTKQELRQLAQALKKAEQAMKEGDEKGAAEQLEKAADQCAKLDPNGEQAELARQITLLKQARQALCRGMNGNQPATGARPRGKDQETQHLDTRSRTKIDEKGQIDIVDFVPGQGFKGPFKPSERRNEIRRAAQQASEAIDRQRLPRSATSMTRGYFENLREPEEK